MHFFLGLVVQNKNTGCPSTFTDNIVVLPYQLYGEHDGNNRQTQIRSSY